MKPENIFDYMYYGDSWCEDYSFSPERKEFMFTIDSISREGNGEMGIDWNYSIEHARLVFTGVENYSYMPEGCEPNDFIGEIFF